MREVTGLVYKLTIKEANKPLDEITHAQTTQGTEEATQASYEQAHSCIREPWLAQVKKRRHKSGPHVNAELLRFWDRKKLSYDRWKWRPTEHNKRIYKEAVYDHNNENAN